MQKWRGSKTRKDYDRNSVKKVEHEQNWNDRKGGNSFNERKDYEGNTKYEAKDEREFAKT